MVMLAHVFPRDEASTPKADKFSTKADKLSSWPKQEAGVAKNFATLFGRKEPLSPSSSSSEVSPRRPLLSRSFSSDGESSDDDSNTSSTLETSIDIVPKDDLEALQSLGLFVDVVNSTGDDNEETNDEFVRLEGKLLGGGGDDWIDSFSTLLDIFESVHLPKAEFESTHLSEMDVESTHLLVGEVDVVPSQKFESAHLLEAHVVMVPRPSQNVMVEIMAEIDDVVRESSLCTRVAMWFFPSCSAITSVRS
jgi:hypothetical protein